MPRLNFLRLQRQDPRRRGRAKISPLFQTLGWHPFLRFVGYEYVVRSRRQSARARVPCCSSQALARALKATSCLPTKSDSAANFLLRRQ